jgi:toxin ParE1/3/4
MGTSRPFDHPTLAGLRSWRIKDFASYLVFSIPTEAGIEVVRVLHGARDIERIFER